MSTFTVNYKDAPSPAPQTSYIVDAGDADNSDDTQNAQGQFTVFYKDTMGDVVTSPTTVINGAGAGPPTQPQTGLNGGSVTGADTIQIRRDLAANWQTVNPVLLSGELAFSTDTKQIRVGDGVSTWSELPNLLEVAPYQTVLGGSCVQIAQAVHQQGTAPTVEIYAPDGSLVSVCVSVDSAGNVEIASSHDLTGFRAVIRA